MSLLSLAQFKRGKELEELLSSGGGGSAVSKVKTAVPCQTEKIVYTGEELSPVWDNFDESTVFIEGKAKAVDIGEYTVTFYPKTGYMWPDKTDGAKNVKWQIDKAPVDETTPIFRHIDIRNVVCNGAGRAMEFNGLPEMPIDGITLTDIDIIAKRDAEFHNSENSKKHNVKITLEK